MQNEVGKGMHYSSILTVDFHQRFFYLSFTGNPIVQKIVTTFHLKKETFLPRSFTGNLTVHAFEPGGTLAFSWMRTIVLPLSKVFIINGILMIWP